MEMPLLPFKPATLALAIAASVLASYPAPRVFAAERTLPDSEWRCKTAPDGQWSCSVVAKQPSPIQRAPLTRVTPAIQQQQDQQQQVQQQSTRVIAITTPDSTHPLDWVPKDQLTETQASQLPYYRCGAYMEPARPGQFFQGDPNAAPIIAEADTSHYDTNNVATLIGSVNVRQAGRQLTSDTATLNQDTDYGQFEGNVHFREPGVLLLGDKGDLQLDTGRATLEKASYVMHEDGIRGNADLIVRNEEGTFDLTHASYTTCPPGDKGWLLSGDTVSIDQEAGVGIAKDATIRVQGMPILYTPWISFPLDDRRKSGLLYPAIGVDGNNGVDMALPYYWNIAPNYDATLTPRIMSKRGTLLENEFRYLIGHTQGELGLSGLLNRDKVEQENPFYDKKRWLFNIRQTSQLTPHWRADIDYAKASDKKYLEDFGSDLNLSNQNPLNQSVSTRYDGVSSHYNWYASIDAHQYQNMNRTSDDPYNKLPEVIVNGDWNTGDRLTLGYTTNYTHFSRDKDWDYINETLSDAANNVYESHYGAGYGIKKANGERLYLETRASYPMEWSYAFLTPAISIQHTQYRLSNINQAEVVRDLDNSYGNFTKADYTTSPSTTVPTISLDSGLYFDRFTHIGGTSFTHTLEPRMKYLYSPYIEGQAMNPIFDSSLQSFSYSSLWRDSRFSGYDRLGDNNQISLGVTTRLLEEDGFERVRFGIGQTYYFKDRRLWISPITGYPKGNQGNWEENLSEEGERLQRAMAESTSPVASELIYNINRSMSVRQDVMWDSNNNELDNYGLYYVYKPAARSVLNLGYRYRKQADRYVKNTQNASIPIDPADLSKGYQTVSNNMSQSDVSLAWPLVQNWSALGRWQYDITNQRHLEKMAGIEYNSCCYQVRFLWRNWIESGSNIDHPTMKDGFFLQFILRGLGDLTGGAATEHLNGITGYEWDEK